MADIIVTDVNKLKVVSTDTTMDFVTGLLLEGRINRSLQDAWTKGFGLAAIQIGVPVKYALYHFNGEQKILLNTKIIEYKNKIRCRREGCLSIPNLWIDTIRYRDIVYENNGTVLRAFGLEAQIIQHEVDHFNGVLCIDKEYKEYQIGRNELCFCGSGLKYKKCCLL